MKSARWTWGWVAAFVVLALVSACSEKGAKQGEIAGDSSVLSTPPSPSDTLAIGLDTLLLHDTSCKNSIYACTYVMIEVPDLGGSGATPALASNLMRGIGLATNMVADTAKRIPPLPSLGKAFVDSFIHELALYRSQDPEARIMPWFMEVRTKIDQQQGLVFLSTETFTFTGGAHPYMYNGYRAFDRLSGAPVTLDNLLQDTKAKTAVVQMAEQKFRAQEGLDPKDDYSAYTFKGGLFSIPNNWRFEQDSLEFVYNLYEIKPYAAGFTYLKLPLSALDSLLVPAYRRPVM